MTIALDFHESFLAVVDNGNLRFLDLSMGTGGNNDLQTFKFSHPVSSVAFSVDGKTLFVCSKDSENNDTFLEGIDTVTHEIYPCFPFAKGSFSLDAPQLLVYCRNLRGNAQRNGIDTLSNDINNLLMVYNTETFEQLPTMSIPDPREYIHLPEWLCTNVVVSPKGDKLYTWGDSPMFMEWDSGTLMPTGIFKGHATENPECKCQCNSDECKCSGHVTIVTDVKCSSTGILISGSSSELILWDPEKRTPLHVVQKIQVFCLAFCSNDDFIAIGTSKSVNLYSAKTLGFIDNIEVNICVHCIACSQNNSLAIGGRGNTFYLWNSKGMQNRTVSTTGSEATQVSSIVFYSSGKYIAMYIPGQGIALHEVK